MAETPVILLAEDRDDDILLLRKAFQKASVNSLVYVVRDGSEAIDYLEGVGKYSNHTEFPLPDLMLLDLKMPKIDGFGVLKWLREQPSFGLLRVVVLTSSDYMNDVTHAYQVGANSFIAKPHDFETFLLLCRSLTTYWLQLSQAPQIARRPRPKPKPLDEL